MYPENRDLRSLKGKKRKKKLDIAISKSLHTFGAFDISIKGYALSQCGFIIEWTQKLRFEINFEYFQGRSKLYTRRHININIYLRVYMRIQV